MGEAGRSAPSDRKLSENKCVCVCFFLIASTRKIAGRPRFDALTVATAHTAVDDGFKYPQTPTASSYVYSESYHTLICLLSMLSVGDLGFPEEAL